MMPPAARVFVDFAALLRAHGFAIAPDQTMGLIEAVGLLGPRSMADIRRAGVAMLAIPNAREAEFDALFQAFFLGQTLSAPATGDDPDAVEAFEATGNTLEVEETGDDEDSGAEAAALERLSHRSFDMRDTDPLIGFARALPRRLPLRLSYRRVRARKGDRIDMVRLLREAVRRDGEVFTLPQWRRRLRQRKIVLLVDVSGSMAERTEGALRIAHVLAHRADRFEAFTLGTRLTRVTPALKPADPDRALAEIGALVADIDGGTRIGEALSAFLAIPRWAGFSRGAAVIVLSDGLERGEPQTFVDAVGRLSRMAWRLDWLTPLAADPAYRPETAAMRGVARMLGHLGDGSDPAAICAHILGLGRAA